jgi:hypothetical protein
MTYMKNVNGIDVPCTPEEIAEIEAREAAWAAGQATRDALSQITALEGQVTQRRIREAALTPEGKAWLQSIEDQIKTLRTKL